jgi:hypothetical protein
MLLSLHPYFPTNPRESLNFAQRFSTQHMHSFLDGEQDSFIVSEMVGRRLRSKSQ